MCRSSWACTNCTELQLFLKAAWVLFPSPSHLTPAWCAAKRPPCARERICHICQATSRHNCIPLLGHSFRQDQGVTCLYLNSSGGWNNISVGLVVLHSRTLGSTLGWLSRSCFHAHLQGGQQQVHAGQQWWPQHSSLATTSTGISCPNQQQLGECHVLRTENQPASTQLSRCRLQDGYCCNLMWNLCQIISIH